MSKQFINRDEELTILNERLKSKKGEFFIIYGRRRVGKTELLLQFLRSSNGLYLLARQESSLANLKRFSFILSECFNDEFLTKNPLTNFDAFFEYLYSRTKKSKKKLVVVVDEFPYLVKAEPSLPSIIQDFWDNRLKNSNIFLILCGSSISMMENLLGYKSPLYGRRTGQLKIEPLKFFDAVKFFKKYDIEKKIVAYSILGGTPAYLEVFSDEFNIQENIFKNFLRKGSFLYQDALFILREELTEPRFYFSILKSIAFGNTKIGDIINDTGLERGIVGKYLSVLIDLGFVRREIPITEGKKSRKGLYKISDNFFKFWFRFIYPNLEYIETRQTDKLLRKIKNQLNAHVGETFEEISKEFLMELNKTNKLPLNFTKIGKWWYKDKEIDIVALDEEKKRITFFEVKWSKINYREAVSLLKELKETSQFVPWLNEERDECFGLIAKRIEDKKKLKKQGYFAFDLEDLKNFNF
jgi:hypothetical protein